MNPNPETNSLGPPPGPDDHELKAAYLAAVAAVAMTVGVLVGWMTAAADSSAAPALAGLVAFGATFAGLTKLVWMIRWGSRS